MNSVILVPPKFRNKFLVPVFISIILIMYSCNDNPTGPGNDNAGIVGTIMDTAGHPLDSVQIYCLYYYYNVPVSPYDKISINRNQIADSSVFTLYQNIPNPFNESTYIRFYLPSSSQIKLTLSDKITGETVYDYKDSKQAGLYQIYLDRIVMYKNLRNGLYKYSLTAKDNNGKIFSADKEMLIINDSSQGNSTTDNNGYYHFYYNNIFEGDSVISTRDGYFYYSNTLTNTVNLELKRRGYNSKIVSVTLYPNLLLRQDFVMIKKVQR